MLSQSIRPTLIRRIRGLLISFNPVNGGEIYGEGYTFFAIEYGVSTICITLGFIAAAIISYFIYQGNQIASVKYLELSSANPCIHAKINNFINSNSKILLNRHIYKFESACSKQIN